MRKLTSLFAFAAGLCLIAGVDSTGAQYDEGEPGSPGDFDANGWVGLLDFAGFTECMAGPGVPPDPPAPTTLQQCLDIFDGDQDGDVDWNDFGTFQTQGNRHIPIPLRDTVGNVLTLDSTTPYSGRQTCAGSCHAHDIDYISNGFKFQQGRTDLDGNIIMQDDFFGDGRWWQRSPGRHGTCSPAGGMRIFAGKDNTSESDLNMTTYRWIAECTSCHPGGGGGEFDRDGKLLYNQVTGQFGYEALGKTPEDVIYDGDYSYIDINGENFGPARWDITGLSEPDCLYCHVSDPAWDNGVNTERYDRRRASTQAREFLVDDAGSAVPAFASAGVASQGWFSNMTIENGAATVLQIDFSVGVDTGKLMTNEDATLAIARTSVERPPRDHACWQCHGPIGWERLRGGVWFDTRDFHWAKLTNRLDEDPDNDIPVGQSRTCTFCHPGNLEHNFAKGNSLMMRTLDELDWVNLRTCRDCHLTELPNHEPNPLKYADAPDVPGDVAVHQIGFYDDDPGPMRVLSCQACHITVSYATAGDMRAFSDTSLTGASISYYADEFYSADPVNPLDADKSAWYPGLYPKVDSDGVTRLFPAVPGLQLYWADWDQRGTPEDKTDDLIKPILKWQLIQMTGGEPLPEVTDDNGDGKLEINRPAEILAYIQALKGNDNYGHQIAANPVYVRGWNVWYEDPDAPGGVNSFAPDEFGIKTGWTGMTLGMNHNPRRANEAWGAGGDCQVCHRTDGLSPVFDRVVLMDPFGPDGLPVYQTVRQMTNVDTTSYHDNIVLKDVFGEPLTVDSTLPYSGRQTCGDPTVGCHDIARITNGMIHQQGRTDAEGHIIMQDDFFDDGRWWVRSAGMYGRWSGGGGGLNRQTAGKDNLNESEMDMTAFYWSSFCGGCHAGGGGMEFDRDGYRYYDQTTGQFGYEVLGKSPQEVALDGDYAFIDADNGGSWSMAPWDVTGVADPECLHCHRADRVYVDNQDMVREWRAAVLDTKDRLVDSQGQSVPAFAVAGTAGQGWFSVLNTASDPPVLQIDYGVGVDDGSLSMSIGGALVLPKEQIARPPRDQACWGCHLPGGFQGKRGTVWFDERDVMYAGFNNLLDADPDNDIPPDQSTACNYCHPGNLDHNFAKGDSPYASFRAELDWVGFRSCRDCHLVEINGQPNPLKDPAAPDVAGGSDPNQIHYAGSDVSGPLAAMSCQACHVPYPLEKANMVTDRSLTGTAVTYLTDDFLSADPLDPTSPDKSTWYPALNWKTDSDGVQRLFPQKMELEIYWADWNQNGTPQDMSDDTIQPIILWRVRQITGDTPLPVATDDNGDGIPEVNRPEEMVVYMKALKAPDSYGVPVANNPVLVKGERVWYFDPQSSDGVSWFDYQDSGVHVEGFEIFGLDHNVLAKEEAWGAGFPPHCDDCHRSDGLSPVFDRLVLMDPWDVNGYPVYKTVRQMTGATPPPQ